MESAAILRMCIEAPENGYYIGTIISDDDTNMRAHLKHVQTNNKGKLPVSKFMYSVTLLCTFIGLIFILHLT